MTLEQEVLLENYKNPKYYGEPSFEFSNKAVAINTICGDELTLWVKLNQDRVEKISFIANACSITVASTSILLQHVVSNNLLLENITPDLILSLIPIELTPSRTNCALLCFNAIQQILKK